MATTQQVTLIINDQERQIIINLLDQAIQETHSEARRTEAPDYQQAVHQEEALLRALSDKVRACTA